MKKISFLSFMCVMGSQLLSSQTDAYIKIHDIHERHPRVNSISFPGDVDNIAIYDAIYGHGAVIENPWVAYRVYMDNRQSLDLYVKKTPRLELDETGFYTTPQQLEDGYGCDVLWAGKSIGAGSFRGWQNDKAVTIDTVALRTQTVLGNSVIEVSDSNWIFNGHPLQMKQLYSVEPDSRDLNVKIILNGVLPEDRFAIGVQKLETDNVGFIDRCGKAGSWGFNVPDKENPENIEQVGLGIFADPINIVDVREDELNYIFIVRPGNDNAISYKVISCGGREADGFKNSQQWFDYLKNLEF